MPFPTEHWLLVMSGPLFAGERWSMGVRISQDFDSTAAADPAFGGQVCQDYADAVAAGLVAGELKTTNAATLDTVKMNMIGVDGRYVHSHTNLVEYATPLFNAVQFSHAPQVSLVATLQTDASRGLAARGRIFIPSPAAVMGGDGLISAANAAAYATSVATFVNRLNAVAPNRRVQVCSDVREGAMRPVTSVGVGRVLDTMRSRRRSLAEDRASAAVLAPT